MYLILSTLNAGDSVKPFNKIYALKYFAQYIVCTHKPKHLREENDGELNEAESDLKAIFDFYLEELHPEYPSPHADFIRLLKLISSSLCERVKAENTQLANNPDYEFKHLCLTEKDFKYFINLMKP